MKYTAFQKTYDWFCAGVLLVFLSVVMAYGPDIHHVFIPAEILFLFAFGIRFFLNRYKITAFAFWSLAFIVVSSLSVLYANNTSLALSRVKSVIQVLVFANLLVPYFMESKQTYQRFLYIYLLSALFVAFRIFLSAPLSILLASRFGDTIQVNSNTIGYIFSIASIVSLHLILYKRKWLLILPLMAFFVLALLTGSRKVFILLGVGFVMLILLQQKNLKNALFAAGIGVVLVLLGVFAVFTFEPLKQAIGQRLLNMLISLSGNVIDESVSIRLNMVFRGLEMFKEHPLFGWGLGAFTDLGGFEMYAHNNYVELLVAVGLFGTLVYYSIPIYIVVRGIKRFLQFGEKGSFVLSTAIMSAMLIDQVARVTYTEEFSNILLALCYAGIVMGGHNSGLDVFQLFAKIIEWIRHPSMVVNHILKWKICRLLSDRLFLAIKYRMSIGRRLHLDNPKTYNEKLQWQKVYDHNPLYPTLVDKYAVREYVAAKVGERYLVPLVGVFDGIKDIDVAALPSSFVMKPTHTSGDVLFCKDRTSFDWDSAKHTMERWITQNYYWYDREWPYKLIKPRIICEHLINTIDGNPPRDYKIFCFNGKPKMAFVASDRSQGTKFDFFDIEWNRLDLSQHYPNSTYDIPKPAKWDEMLTLATVLSHGFPQVRVDLYVDAGENILFGELTFFHFSGFEPFEPDSFDDRMGSWLNLPLSNK